MKILQIFIYFHHNVVKSFKLKRIFHSKSEESFNEKILNQKYLAWTQNILVRIFEYQISKKRRHSNIIVIFLGKTL